MHTSQNKRVPFVKTALAYAAVGLLLGIYWVLGYQLEDIFSSIYLNFSLRNAVPLLPLLAGVLLGLCMKAPASRGWAVFDGIAGLFLLPAAFRGLTFTLIGVGRWSWLPLHTPAELSGMCTLICGLLLGHMIQILRQPKVPYGDRD